ncbi:MAG: transposase domain-containing protein [Aliishimia sp.]
MIETCKLNGIEPHAYLTNVLTGIINGQRQNQIEELRLWKFRNTI